MPLSNPGGVSGRLLDILGATLGLIVLSPLIAVIALSVRWKLGRPILFRQRRPGLGGRPFEMVKFRTMLNAAEGADSVRFDARRITPFGRWLRSSSLDELPELWNVLRGEMSLVGPRPLLMAYVDRYSPEQARRHEVKPGITGWAQINGRNAVSWSEKFGMDTWYVDHRSLWLDLKIIALTVVRVFRREGISAAGEATMPEFLGNAADGGLD